MPDGFFSFVFVVVRLCIHKYEVTCSVYLQACLQSKSQFDYKSEDLQEHQENGLTHRKINLSNLFI